MTNRASKICREHHSDLELKMTKEDGVERKAIYVWRMPLTDKVVNNAVGPVAHTLSNFRALVDLPRYRRRGVA
jgi:hypothetical protein